MADPRTYLSPEGDVITAQSDEEAAAFKRLNYAPASAAQATHSSLVEQMSNPIYGAAVGAIRGVPLLQSAILKGTELYAGAEKSKAVAQSFDAAAEASPYAAALGQIAGTGLTIAATGGAGALTAGAGTAAKVAAFAAEGAGLGAASKVDEAVLHYASTGEGTEKLYQEVGTAALLGAFLNTGLGVGGKVLFAKGVSASSRVSQALSAKAQSIEEAQLISAEARKVLQRRGVEDATLNYARDVNLYKIKPSEQEAFLKDELKRAHGLVKSVKFGSDESLQLGESVQLQDTLTKAANGFNRTFANKIDQQLKRGTTLQNLHNLRHELDKLADWDNPNSVYMQQFMQIRQPLTDALMTLAGRSRNPEILPSFVQANKIFAGATNLLRAAPKGDSGFFSEVASALGSSVGGAAGASVGGAAGAAAGSFAGRGLTNPQQLKRAAASGLRGLAAAFNAADSKAAAAMLKGLGQRGGVEAATQELIPSHKYKETAAAVKNSQLDPADHNERFAQHLEEQGVPAQVIDNMVPQHAKAMAYVASQVPTSPFVGQTVSPEQYTPTSAEKNRFMEKVNAVVNPAEALANPTPGKVEALKAVYPEYTQRAADAVSAHAAQNPLLSRRGKQYTSSLNGLAPNGLRTQQVQAGLALLQAQAKQRLMAAQGPRGPGGRPSGPVQSAQPSRTERLAN